MSSREILSFNQFESLRGRRIALIGGAGFIGHHLALKLRSRGAEVDVVDSLQVNHLQYVATKVESPYRSLYLKMLIRRLELMEQAGVRLHTIDARDYHSLSMCLGKANPQTVVQLAAVAHANRSNKDPFSTFDHSLRTLENALDCSRGRCEHFIFFSSSMVYGNFKTPVVDEEHPLNPIGIYGALKLSGEKMVEAYNQVFGLPYTIIRPSALYGPRCVSRRVSQIFLENAMLNEPLKMEGDGMEKIDFTYVDDLTEGICLSMVKPQAMNQTFNLTCGNARSLRELADVVKMHYPKVAIEYVERDALRPFRGTLSIDKAKELIGYHSAHQLEEGIPKCIDSYIDLGFVSGRRAMAA